MLYYKKDDRYFVRLDAVKHEYLELFDGLDQTRIMRISNINLYNDLSDRIQNSSPQTISDIEFESKLLEVKNKL